MSPGWVGGQSIPLMVIEWMRNSLWVTADYANSQVLSCLDCLFIGRSAHGTSSLWTFLARMRCTDNYVGTGAGTR